MSNSTSSCLAEVTDSVRRFVNVLIRLLAGGLSVFQSSFSGQRSSRDIEADYENLTASFTNGLQRLPQPDASRAGCSDAEASALDLPVPSASAGGPAAGEESSVTASANAHGEVRASGGRQLASSLQQLQPLGVQELQSSPAQVCTRLLICGEAGVTSGDSVPWTVRGRRLGLAAGRDTAPSRSPGHFILSRTRTSIPAGCRQYRQCACSPSHCGRPCAEAGQQQVSQCEHLKAAGAGAGPVRVHLRRAAQRRWRRGHAPAEASEASQVTRNELLLAAAVTLGSWW